MGWGKHYEVPVGFGDLEFLRAWVFKGFGFDTFSYASLAPIGFHRFGWSALGSLRFEQFKIWVLLCWVVGDFELDVSGVVALLLLSCCGFSKVPESIVFKCAHWLSLASLGFQ